MVQDILTESFDPIVELTTGADLMMAMVYAQELGDWDYSGMYTAVLKFKVCMPKLWWSILCYYQGLHDQSSQWVQADLCGYLYPFWDACDC